MRVEPRDIRSHPGARIVFSCDRPVSTLVGAEVVVYFPGRAQQNATIHETDNTFSYIVPPEQGTHEVSILLQWRDGSEWDKVKVHINPAQAPVFNITTHPLLTPTPPVYADVYDPMGVLMESVVMDRNGQNFSYEGRPGVDWLEGEYTAAIRDNTGVIDKYPFWVHRPKFAAMKEYYDLPPWQRQMVEYIKYDMMGDTDPLHPGAYYTIEEYTRHWKAVVDEVNNIPPYTRFPPRGIPTFWANVMAKGTLCRIYHSLANRGVTIPRWQGVSVPIQDESHYQGAWEQRYNLLRPEYVEERGYMKGLHLPGPQITVDPWLGWAGGNLAGTSGLALIGMPSWFARPLAGTR